ncbi:MAG TPA: carboxypeptidase-like regulatory domain-containing protein [Gemmatimonadaceae bacterium]|nr:carboxypeptidase-like regulatory domain-containing protein [Gemmatimonadaceae bacterium]
MRCALVVVMSLIATAAVRAQGTTGRLEGVVTDSVRGEPMSGVMVSAKRLDAGEGTALTAMTDQRGRYQFDLAPGRYSVSFASTLLDSLEYGVASVVTTVPLGSIPARVDLATPSGKTLRAAACPGTGLARWTGALLGVVSDAENLRPLDGAEVFVSWTEQTIDSTTRDITNQRRVAQVKTNSSGQYRLCGLPTDERINVQIGYRGATGPIAVVMIADDIGVRVRNVAVRSQLQGAGDIAKVAQIVVEPPRPGRSSVVGRITRPDGQPLAGAQLRLLDGVTAARSNELGEFSLTGLGAGTHELEVRSLGYGLARRAITLRDGETSRENITMERVVSLDSVRVVAHRMSYPEFEKNRARYNHGTFLDADEIAKRGYRTLPLLVTSTRGFRLALQSRGRMGVQSNYATRCGLSSAGTERLPSLNLVVDNMEHMDLADVFFPIVEAVEIYPEGENAPFKYDRACAVIVVWTKWSAKKPKPDPAFQQLKGLLDAQKKREEEQLHAEKRTP